MTQFKDVPARLVHLAKESCIDSVRLLSPSVNEKIHFFKILLIFYNKSLILSTAI